MNYSHILTIQIWSEKNNITTNYGNILNRVKSVITDDIQTQEINCNGKKELITILWKPINWNTLNNALYNSNIVTDSFYIKDEIIYQHTKQMLEEIETRLAIEKKFDCDYKIKFSIVKPVSQNQNENSIEFLNC